MVSTGRGRSVHFSTRFDRQVRDTGKLRYEERARVDIEVSETVADLEIDYEVRSLDGTDREATTVRANDIDIRDIRKIQNTLTDWCRNEVEASCQLDTGLIRGECIRDGASEEYTQLRLTIESDGIQFEPVTENMTLGTVTIPPCPVTQDDGPLIPRYYHELELLLRTALLCIDEQRMEQSRRLDVAGEFSGPLDERLERDCTGHYFSGSDVNAASVGCHALDRHLRRLADASPGQPSTNLAGELFSEGTPRLKVAESSSVNKGIQFLIQGALMAFRNPLTHRDPRADDTEYLESFDQRYARDIIYFLDLLFLLFEDEIELIED